MSKNLDDIIESVRKRVEQGGGPMWELALTDLTQESSEQGKVALAIFRDLVANNERKLPLFDHGSSPEEAQREEVERFILEFQTAADTISAEFHLEDSEPGVWLHLGGLERE